jgi:hypothetical protein
MPRNSSGVYSLPVAPFVPGGLIKSADMNSNFSDIATALTGSLAVNGSAGMTGPFLAADGTAAAPGISFKNDPTTGFYRSGGAAFIWLAGGTPLGLFNAAGLSLYGNLSVAGGVTFGSLVLGGGISASTGFVSGLLTVGSEAVIGGLAVGGLLTAVGGLTTGIPGLSISLATPLSAANGGTPFYYGAALSGGSANAQTMPTAVPSNYAYGAGQLFAMAPGFTNTAAMTFAPNSLAARNVYKQIAGSPAALVGGEVQTNNWALMLDDGTEFQLLNPWKGVVSLSGSTGLTPGYHNEVVEVTANVTITLPAPFAGGSIQFINAASNTFTLAAASGHIYTTGAFVTSMTIPARVGAAVYVAVSDGTNWFVGALTAGGYQAPALQNFTGAGGATYTPTAGTTLAEVEMVAAGGGGGGAQASPSNGSAGGSTVFGSWTCIGGGGATGQTGGIGGTGGVNGGTGTLETRQAGTAGGNSSNAVITFMGAPGNSLWSPAGSAYDAGSTGPGANGLANTGQGGWGGYYTGSNNGASGGGGEYVKFFVSNPAAVSIVVATAGAGGVASYSGGNGSVGRIKVKDLFF